MNGSFRYFAVGFPADTSRAEAHPTARAPTPVATEATNLSTSRLRINPPCDGITANLPTGVWNYVDYVVGKDPKAQTMIGFFRRECCRKLSRNPATCGRGIRKKRVRSYPITSNVKAGPS